MTDRIGAAFSGHGKRAALMPYLMGGFPDLDASRAIGRACVEAGADLLEVGVPYSDPLADGPVIHEAGSRALAAGATPGGVFEVIGDLAELCPVVCMCYANLVYARGPARFTAELAERGAAGLIVPDLPLEERAPIADACAGAGLALVPLVAPTTPADRLRQIGAVAQGFVYTVAVAGTTGERTTRDGGTADLLGRVRAATDVPVALGFGISTPADAAAAADAGADGVIVGSRLVRAAAEAPDDPAAAVGAIVGELAIGLRA